MIGRSREMDELPDAVVRMYGDSLDEDGLDFLRRGPRSARERLAYAQRVHPDASRTAELAGQGAQAALARDGILDGRRHFVGPDAMVYRRGEATEEPLHASIRRGFESAVPGFRQTGLGEALAETMALGGGGGADLLAGDTGGGDPTSRVSTGPGWQPAHEGGPLRMKEIALWSRHAAPADAGGLDPHDQIDVLRHLRFLHGEGSLSEAQRALGREVAGSLAWDDDMLSPRRQQLEALMQRIASDPEVRDALARWNGGNKWSTLTPEQQGAVLERVVGQLAQGLGVATPSVRYHPMSPEIAGQYSVDTGDLELNSTMKADDRPDLLPIRAMSVPGHEIGHAWQEDLRDRWVSGALQATDPDYALGELAALTYPFFVTFGTVEQDRYSKQVLERWAEAVRDVLFGELYGSRPPTLELPPE